MHSLVLVTLALGVSACGQKGPLMLPDAQHPHKKIGLPKPPASSAPAPAAPAGSTPASPADATPTGEAKADPAPPR
jgi:predicted small lipoprotein YifL